MNDQASTRFHFEAPEKKLIAWQNFKTLSSIYFSAQVVKQVFFHHSRLLISKEEIILNACHRCSNIFLLRLLLDFSLMLISRKICDQYENVLQFFSFAKFACKNLLLQSSKSGLCAWLRTKSIFHRFHGQETIKVLLSNFASLLIIFIIQCDETKVQNDHDF